MSNLVRAYSASSHIFIDEAVLAGWDGQLYIHHFHFPWKIFMVPIEHRVEPGTHANYFFF